ncbi:MAG TPA: polyamine aminopropyltransferase, partial [Alphaproteobacteria bacterium]|nr:polyamine aminopropyltransferase [Alphaproteobacteria bacterium]
ILEHFATHKKETAGYTFLQMIETSNIAAHFAENLGEVYIDIFSCRDFDADIAKKVTEDHFQPQIARMKNFNRGETFQENLYGNRVYQGFAIDDVLYEGQSDYQKLSFFENKEFGRVLTLDNIIQTTESDEFIYHEMMIHTPLLSIENPKNILIVGGGDGGALREALKHTSLERADMVEIDQGVVDLSNKYLPGHNDGGKIYQHPKANLIIQDAFKYIKETTQKYDVITVDSTDPIGAAEALFSEEFYKLCKDALKPGGILVTQNGVPFLQPDELTQTVKLWDKLGLNGTCYLITVPTYYGGQMALGYGVNGELKLPSLETLQSRLKTANLQNLRQYTPEVHLGAFALPKWIQDIMAGNAVKKKAA